MNRNLIGLLTIGALLLLVSVPNTYAQNVTTATVPFAFTIGRSEMPAGTYTIWADERRPAGRYGDHARFDAIQGVRDSCFDAHFLLQRQIVKQIRERFRVHEPVLDRDIQQCFEFGVTVLRGRGRCGKGQFFIKTRAYVVVVTRYLADARPI